MNRTKKGARLTKTKYSVLLSEDDRISVEIQILKNKVVAFSVNYHARINRKFIQIWRADSAHHGNTNRKGVAHFHQYYRKKKQRREFIGTDLNKIVTKSINYVKGNYKNIKENYLLN